MLPAPSHEVARVAPDDFGRTQLDLVFGVGFSDKGLDRAKQGHKDYSISDRSPAVKDGRIKITSAGRIDERSKAFRDGLIYYSPDKPDRIDQRCALAELIPTQDILLNHTDLAHREAFCEFAASLSGSGIVSLSTSEAEQCIRSLNRFDNVRAGVSTCTCLT